MDFNELTPMQQLAFVQSLYKKLAEMVSTKNPESLRGEVDRVLKDLYAKTGAKSYDVNINGVKCGTMSVTVKKSTTTTDISITDRKKLMEWLKSSDGQYAIFDFAYNHMDEFLRYLLDKSGEIPDGVDVTTITYPEYVSGTTMRIDEKKVARAFGTELLSTVAGLLEG